MQGAQPDSRDMPLPPGEYMHVQDTTKGPIKVYVGPMVVNQTGQEQPVVYDANDRHFQQTDMQGARKKCVFVPEDSYCSLRNPSVNAGVLAFPNEGQCSNPTSLQHGECVNIPGPAHFALWPEQSASVISGHRLRSNQYLLVEVVNGAKAQTNWKEATVETAEGEDVTKVVAKRLTFRTGEQIIIKGTEAGFFIPCTGVRVVPDGRSYVRDAMTLEQLEFCILVGEDGEKRYEKGPQVVFPLPTEEFWTDEKNNKKFRAYELSKISALYIKVIAPYEEDGKTHKAGEELFITGATAPIYYPRPEHAIVKYGASELHYATAVTKGEGRYVLDRLHGHVETEVGEQMLLPDARTHVIVKRILTSRECELWFPGNRGAVSHNEALRAEATSSGIGYVESGSEVANMMMKSGAMDFDAGEPTRSRRVRAASSAVADEMRRGTGYTPPRSITLDTKMDGAVCIQVWTGFAIMVVGKDGKRKPVIGPATVLLDYDQSLEVLRLSTEKPKNTDNLYETVYLNVANNKVSDVVDVHTRDQVQVKIKLSFHVDFTGEPEKWFNVENYVKLLCDRVRSILKGVIRKVDIETLFADHVSIIRDTLLGEHDKETGDRVGMTFESNGMKVIDVDVLGFDIPDSHVSNELVVAQRRALTTSLSLQNKQREVEAEERYEKLEQQLQQAKFETAELQTAMQLKKVEAIESVGVRQQEADQTMQLAKHETALARQDTHDLEHTREIKRTQMEHAEEIEFKKLEEGIRLAGVKEETAAVTERLGAASTKLTAALEGSIKAGALQTFAEKGFRVGLMTGAPVMETIRRTLGPGLADMLEQGAEGFFGDGDTSDTPMTPLSHE